MRAQIHSDKNRVVNKRLQLLILLLIIIKPNQDALIERSIFLNCCKKFCLAVKYDEVRQLLQNVYRIILGLVTQY